MKGQIAIKHILPALDRVVQTESRYNIGSRSKILAEIALFRAYEREPKFKMFVLAGLLIGAYDFLHTLQPSIYGILFIALATFNGFVSSLRSPAMMAAELEGVEDEDGMPADYRAKALSSVNTNVTVVLFAIAVGVQLLVTSSIIQAELVTQNVATSLVSPGVSALVLLTIPVILDHLWWRSDD